MPFLCKVEAGFDPPTTVDPPTVPPSVPCDYHAEDGWIKMATGADTDFCYKFVATSADSDVWSQAEYYCQQEVDNFSVDRTIYLPIYLLGWTFGLCSRQQ